ncbi:hypothetical protein LSTR_LSTR016344 [Laodelphax striatellus]|uniref:Uncharacterized protein n=1 Tax=Laodelphax striatellus TaxID=195883 RepID=A0A482X0P3_LAOST|nr:hypothetical protein LSTR_LSTR016344 [Laodelphax striatellus]
MADGGGRSDRIAAGRDRLRAPGARFVTVLTRRGRPRRGGRHCISGAARARVGGRPPTPGRPINPPPARRRGGPPEGSR